MQTEQDSIADGIRVGAAAADAIEPMLREYSADHHPIVFWARLLNALAAQIAAEHGRPAARLMFEVAADVIPEEDR